MMLARFEKLFLTAGKLGNAAVKPILNAEIARHFRHTQPHRRLITAEAFQPKRQLVPNLVGYDLTIRILHHIANFGALIAQRNLLNRRAVKQNLPRFLPVR